MKMDRWTRAVAVAAGMLAAVCVRAQGPERQRGGVDAQPAETRQGLFPRERMRGMSALGPGPMRDRLTSGMASMRQHLMAELGNVPALAGRLKELQQVQQERFGLVAARERLARESGNSSGEVLRKFHENLAREDRLTSRIEQIQKELAGNLDEIQRQIADRRAVLQADLDTALVPPGEGVAVEPGKWQEARNLRASLRMYDTLLERIAGLRDDPKQFNIGRFLSRLNASSEELDPVLVGQAQRRLTQLQGDLDDVRRRAEMLQDQVDELRELLDAAGTSRRGGFERREGAGPGPGEMPGIAPGRGRPPRPADGVPPPPRP